MLSSRITKAQDPRISNFESLKNPALFSSWAWALGSRAKHDVCMYRGRLMWRCPWDRAFQLGRGEGPIGIVGPISQPRGTIDTASHAGSYLCTQRAFSEPTLISAAKGLLYPHVGGTVTHQARYYGRCNMCMCQLIFLKTCSYFTNFWAYPVLCGRKIQQNCPILVSVPARPSRHVNLFLWWHWHGCPLLLSMRAALGWQSIVSAPCLSLSAVSSFWFTRTGHTPLQVGSANNLGSPVNRAQHNSMTIFLQGTFTVRSQKTN